MENMLDKIERLEREHDRLDPELVKLKKVKLGLRNEDGTGVVAGITSKGQVEGFKRDEQGNNIAIPGKLIYCGYDVEDIVSKLEAEHRFGFEETAYLLLTGELPNKQDLESFNKEFSTRRELPDLAKSIIRYNSENNDQMGALHTAIAVLHKLDPAPKTTDIKEVTRQCIDIIAKFPTIINYNYSVLYSGDNVSSTIIEPDPELNTAQNFFYMLNGEVPEDDVAHAFDLSLILHAEHGGGNNSTFTVRTVSSSLTDTYMAICAGIASLAGYLHGGANEAVMSMMEGIKAKVSDWNDDDAIYTYLEGVIDKKYGDGSGKIYGMGHAVYTLSDPREPIIRNKALYFAKKSGRISELELYDKVAKVAMKVIMDKKGRKVCANVDFYSGFLYDLLGIPSELFTPIFAMARVVGWSAHRIEEIIQGKLIRPAYVSSLKDRKEYSALSDR